MKELDASKGHPLTKGLFDGVAGGTEETTGIQMWMSHGDKVTTMPAGFRGLMATDTCPIAAIANDDARLYGLQFHPEVSGARRRFAQRDLCRRGGSPDRRPL